MNFLAHIYLSGEDENVIIGNFIADGIKGKNHQIFPIGIQRGILLHREIDTFTDSHPIVKKSTRRLHSNYGHYSGVIVDILYDHFLARNWQMYSDIPLEKFVDDFYTLLHKNYDILPLRIQKMMHWMIADNWLLSYVSIDGIARILSQMNFRTKNISKMHLAVNELQTHYVEFEEEFHSFFVELIDHTQKKYVEICKKYPN